MHEAQHATCALPQMHSCCVLLTWSLPALCAPRHAAKLGTARESLRLLKVYNLVQSAVTATVQQPYARAACRVHAAVMHSSNSGARRHLTASSTAAAPCRAARAPRRL